MCHGEILFDVLFYLRRGLKMGEKTEANNAGAFSRMKPNDKAFLFILSQFGIKINCEKFPCAVEDLQMPQHG